MENRQSKSRRDNGRLSPIIRDGLRMDEDAEQFRGFLLEADFNFGLDVVDAGERKIVAHGAVAGDIQAAAHALEENLVHVDDFRKFGDDFLEPLFQVRILHDLVSAFNGGRFTFDMGQYGVDLGHFVTDFCFQDCDPVMRVFQAEPFVKFEMLLDVQISPEILHADVVHVEVVPSRDCPYTVKNILAMLGTGNGMDHDVSVWKHIVNCGSHRVHDLFGALKGDVTVKTDGKVGEVAVPCASNAHAIDFEQTVH